MIDAAIETASRKSRAQAGSGTSITKTTLIAASGSRTSRSFCQIGCPASVAAGRAAVLIASLLDWMGL